MVASPIRRFPPFAGSPCPCLAPSPLSYLPALRLRNACSRLTTRITTAWGRGIFLRLFITLDPPRHCYVGSLHWSKQDASCHLLRLCTLSLVPALIVMIPSHAKDQRYLVGKLANGFLVSLILQFSSSRLHLLIPQVFLAKHWAGATEEPGQPLRRGV